MHAVPVSNVQPNFNHFKIPHNCYNKCIQGNVVVSALTSHILIKVNMYLYSKIQFNVNGSFWYSFVG